MSIGKTVSLPIWTFVSKVMSLLFKMQSRYVIAFLPRGKHLLFSWLQSPSTAILEPPKIKSVTVSTFSPFYFSQHEGLFQWVGCLHKLAKILELQLQHQSFQWIFRVYFLRIDWFDLLAAQGTLKSFLQHHSCKASVLQHSAFFVQLSHDYWKTITLAIWTFIGKVMSLIFIF